ncbi:MAG TPA: PAS domain S-box protein, partial [Candidatus Obscuribacterales bacterium]
REITEQKQLEQRLRDSQFYTRSLFESNTDALMTTDPLGIITDVNQQMEKLTGSSRHELLGSPFRQYFTDPLLAEEAIRQVLKTGQVTNYELTVAGRDKEQDTIVSYNAALFHDASGQLQGVFAAARDITAYKQLEQQLLIQQHYLRGLIESSVDGLITIDTSGYISDINERMCAMSGYSHAELLGTPFADYFTDPDRATAGVQASFAAGSLSEYPLTLISRSRRQFQVSFNASVFKDPSGEITGIFASAHDITDRLHLEAQMRDNQAYNRGLIEASSDGLIIVEAEGFISDVNQQMCQMSGYSREELIGAPFKQYFTEPERADIGVKRTFAEGLLTNYTLVLRARSGRKATISFNASIFRDTDGRIQGIFASVRDISEQAKLEAQLGLEQAYTRSLIEASADALFVVSPEGVITDVSEEATRLTGYSRKHLINSGFPDLFTDPEHARQGVSQTLTERRMVSYELTLITRYGRRVSVSLNAGMFADAQGTPLGVLAAARDITAQNLLELQLREYQFYTRSLIESNIDALMTTDPLGIITDINQQMELLTGCTRPELIGTTFKEYFTDPMRAETGIKEVLHEGKVTDFELTVRSRDGQETVVSYNATTIYDQAGRLQGVFAAARDVTERKRYDVALQEKNTELERANLAKDRFLASMSHELRTPLNAIIGFTGTLLMKLAGPLTGDQSKQLKTIQSSAWHLLAIINDMLDLATIESGKVELNIEPVVIQELVQEIFTTLQPVALEKKLSLELVVPDTPLTLRTDRRSLKQILLNLVNNALKFTEKGSVTLHAESFSKYDQTWLAIRVVDTGIGIQASEHGKLFQPFERVAGKNGLRIEGTGLGLHVSQKLANLLNGQISFDSVYERGSTFSLLLKES